MVQIIIGVIGFVSCLLIIDFVFHKYVFVEKPVGTLRIDTSDPEDGPYIFLELSTDPRNIMREKQVLLNVSTESYLSQK